MVTRSWRLPYMQEGKERHPLPRPLPPHAGKGIGDGALDRMDSYMFPNALLQEGIMS